MFHRLGICYDVINCHFESITISCVIYLKKKKDHKRYFESAQILQDYHFSIQVTWHQNSFLTPGVHFCIFHEVHSPYVLSCFLFSHGRIYLKKVLAKTQECQSDYIFSSFGTKMMTSLNEAPYHFYFSCHNFWVIFHHTKPPCCNSPPALNSSYAV